MSPMPMPSANITTRTANRICCRIRHQVPFMDRFHRRRRVDHPRADGHERVQSGAVVTQIMSIRIGTLERTLNKEER